MRSVVSGCAALLALAVACGDATGPCTLMATRCALQLNLVHEWEPGLYEVRVHSDAEQMVCVGELPREAAFECDPPYEPGVLAPGPIGEFPHSISFESSPDEARVTILHEGVELVSRTVRPHYDVTEPNGEGCGECRNWTMNMEF